MPDTTAFCILFNTSLLVLHIVVSISCDHRPRASMIVVVVVVVVVRVVVAVAVAVAVAVPVAVPVVVVVVVVVASSSLYNKNDRIFSRHL